MRGHSLIICTVLLISAGLYSLAPTSAIADDHPDLTGTWTLNQELSDDPAQVMRQARGGRPDGEPGSRGGGGGGGMGGRGGGMGGRGGGGGGGGGRGGQGTRTPDNQENQEQRLRMQKQLSRLEIFHEGTELNITNGLEISRLYHTDGRQMQVWTEQGMVDASARWEGRQLAVAWEGPRGRPGNTRHFELSEDGRTLTVTELRTLPGKEEPVKLRLVYDRQD